MYRQHSVLTAEQIEAGITLPDRDVRKALDEAVRRGWTEHTRRAARVVTLLALDTIAGLAGIGTALATWELVSADGLRPLPNPVPLIAMVCCIQPLALRVTGAYGGGRARVSLERVAAGLCIAAFVGWIQARLFGQIAPDLPNKTAYIYSAALITLFVWMSRVGVNVFVRAGCRAGVLQRRLVLIAHREDVKEIQKRIDHAPAADIRIVAAISPSRLGGNIDPLDDAIRSSRAHGVLIGANLPFDVLEDTVASCVKKGVSVSLLPSSLQELGAFYFESRQSAAGLLLQVLPLRFGLPQLAVKRTMDIVLTVAGLLVTWPVFVAIAVAIKLDSPGPVLFSQRRVGVGGRTFRMLKFRTMTEGADAMKGQLAHLNASGDPRLFKIRNDPRVTRVGRFLRRTSLDELPQIFNVLRGDMSLVGPRPFFPGDLAAYEIHHFERLHVFPGITGLWQISGRSDVVDFEEVVRLDREYIRNWSVASDIIILLRTLPVAFGRGAY